MILGINKAKTITGSLAAGAAVVLVLLAFGFANTQAATGINQTIEFQGRLLNAQGATVPDGYYNIEFKIYANGNGQDANDTGGSPAGTLLWTEDYLNYNSQGVEVVNGFLSVDLGSVNPFGASINWNQNPLWLSMNVAGTSATCTTFSACSPDGEMLPMQLITSSPYAFESSQLGGLTSSQYVQLAQGAQTDSSTSASIFINKTASSGDLLELQDSGTDAFDVSNSGNLLFGNNTTSHSISANTAASGTAGVGLSVTAGTAGSGSSALAGGALTLSGGNGGGTNGNGGSVTIDAGQSSGSGTGGTISVGTEYASSISIGNSNGSEGVSITVGAGDYQLNGVGASTYGFGAATTTGSLTFGGTSETGALILQGEGIKENVTGSSSDPSVEIQSSTDSTTALQVQNNSNNRVFGVDTTNNQATLGQASALNGTLEFLNSSNGNAITLNSTGTYSSYTLTLPSLAPSPGLCLETSTSSASQLVFVSCSNNNASITELNEWDTSSSNTITVDPTNIGDEMVMTTSIPTSGVTVSSVSGGGVSSWAKVITNSGNSTVSRVEMWVGTVTSTGSSTLTVTYSSSPGTEEVTATEFTAAGVNGATNWGIDASASQLNSTASTTVTFPEIDSTNSDELYVGYAQVEYPPATAGSTTGFSYIITGVQHNVIAYDVSTNANTNYQPTASQNTAGESNTLGVMLTAFVSSTAINNSTSLQKANFYVQSSTSGTVAGVLQAASSGTADILDLRNSSGINVGSIGYNGVVTFENSANSTAAFSIQNSSADSVLGVNTASGLVNLGSADSVAGTLNFYDAINSNAITIAAPTSIAASYSLSLPSNAPSSGLCLETSPSNANQLTFASCAQQVSAASISYVNSWHATGTNTTTLADSPSQLGDLLVFYSASSDRTDTITGLSGGGVTTWVQVTSYNSGATGYDSIQMWRGIVTTTGSETITVTYSANADTNELEAVEYTTGSSNATWNVDTSGTNDADSATVNYPSLTPTNSGELYTGYAESAHAITAGSTGGYTYVAGSGDTYVAYDPSVTGGAATQPTASTATAGDYVSIAATFAAYNSDSVIADSTATQEANFNVQAATSGSVAGVLQANPSGSANILEVENASGYNVAAVNNTGLTLGTSEEVAGSLTFADTSDNNEITLAAPSSIAESYTLALPTSTPTANMCLSTSPSNANQLIYTSCAQQTSSAAISYVNEWDNHGDEITTLAVDPSHVGDIMLFWSYPENGRAISSVSGGGVNSWTQITGNTGSGFGGSTELEMWRGIVTTTGSSTVTVAWPGGFEGEPGNPNELAAMEFTAGSADTSWVVDTSGVQENGASTTVDYPSLSPAYSDDLYAGYADAGGDMSAGATAGYSYITTGDENELAYDTSVSGTQAPTGDNSTDSDSGSIGALIAAFNSNSEIANTTTIQQANIYLQAATSGSVAGIFQAASGGSADILDIRNSSGTFVDGFTSTGNLVLEPSTNSSTAFEVQNSSAVNVFSVNTSADQVKIGAGSTGEASPSVLVLDSETGSSGDPTEVNGAMYYNATTNAFRCGVAGAWENCTGLLYSNANTSAADSICSNNCDAFSTAASVPANYCQAGRVIKLESNGYYSSGSSATTLQFGIYYGTNATTASSDTQIGSLSPSVSTTSASDYYFQIDYNIVCFSTSSMEAEGTLTIQNTSSTASSMLLLPIASTASTTVATSGTNNLYVFPIWGAASSSNTATLTQMIVSGY